MALATCAFGHLYDTELYATCPYCNGAQTSIDFGPAPAAGRERAVTDRIPTGAPGGFGFGPQSTGGPKPGEVPVTAGIPTQAPPGYRPGPGEHRVTERNLTRPPVDYRGGERLVTDEQVTMGALTGRNGGELLVGWLVCVAGAEQGRDYRIWGRVNSIGRSDGNDIVIRSDSHISREAHARLGYDPKKNRFRLIPANNTNNIYLNGEVIDAAAPLNAYDLIEFGETKLIFVPLCTDRFTWEDGKKDEAGHAAV